MPTRLGISGHQDLADASAWAWARQALSALVADQPMPIQAVSSLARGADQLFSEIVLNAGGSLYAVIPFPGYERTLAGEHLDRYHALAARAHVEVRQPAESDEASFWAAGQRVVDLSTLLIAVWDGKPARGLGGTGDVVRYAMEHHKPVVHVNPDRRTVQRLGIAP
ncbi:MAG: hypothetical protein KIS87_02790 [Phycisphaeraceae bacterium]|nr:hypothetical protein [Phycisphaeraceae bacterium]